MFFCKDASHSISCICSKYNALFSEHWMYVTHIHMWVSICCGGIQMTRRAVLPKSHTVTGVFGRVRDKNRFRIFGVFNLEFLEIGEFVWSNRIFPIVFSHVAFDPWCHIAKQMRNARNPWEQGPVSWNRKIACRDWIIIVLQPGRRSRFWAEVKKFLWSDAFSIIARDRPDGIRWGFVKVELKHVRLVWFKPWWPKHFLDAESGEANWCEAFFLAENLQARRSLSFGTLPCRCDFGVSLLDFDRSIGVRPRWGARYPSD